MSAPAKGPQVRNWAQGITKGVNGRRLNASEKVVLLVLALHCKNTVQCFPGLDRIAEQACVTRRTVVTAISSLVAMGLIERDNSRPGKVNTYRLILEPARATATPPTRANAAPPAPAPIAPKQPRPVQMTTVTRANATPEGVLKESIGNNPTSAVSAQRQLALPVLVANNPQPVQPPKRHRLPPSWTPSGMDREYAKARQLNPDDVLLDFRAHFDNAPDSRALKSDWSQTWQWWCRNEVKFYGRSRGKVRMSQAERFAEMMRKERESRSGPDDPEPVAYAALGAPR